MNRRTAWAAAIALAIVVPLAGAQNEIVIVGGTGRHCGEDPGCINRLHPQIPMAARAVPGQTILFKARNASDFDLDPDTSYDDPRTGDPQIGTVHPLAGPVHIEGAEAGDVLAVTLLDIDPGPFGYTVVSPIGFVSDHITGSLRVLWRLDRTEAVTDDIPGVRVPNASFPGVVTVLPGREQLDAMLAREKELADAGGAVFPPPPPTRFTRRGVRSRRHSQRRMPAHVATP